LVALLAGFGETDCVCALRRAEQALREAFVERLKMEMFNPPHPGEIVREDCLIPAGLSVTDGAKQLGANRSPSF
jgi:hypothetical protein